MLSLLKTPLFAVFIGAGATSALASQPGEDKTPPSAAGIAAPINLAPERTGNAPRPVPMAVMNYETFEATVDHADLAECPRALAAEGRFAPPGPRFARSFPVW